MNKITYVFDVIDNDDSFEDINIGHEHVSKYEKSDNELLLSESEGKHEARKCRIKRIIYDPKCNHANMEIVIGKEFENGLQCKETLTTWGIENGRSFQFRCVTKIKVVAFCKPPCPWKVYGIMVQSSGTFMIKIYGGDNNCPRAMTNKLISSK